MPIGMEYFQINRFEFLFCLKFSVGEKEKSISQQCMCLAISKTVY